MTWEEEFRKEPDDLKRQLILISTSNRKSLNSIYKKFKEVRETHPDVTPIQNIIDRNTKTMDIVQSFYANIEEEEEDWKQMIEDTVIEVILQQKILSSEKTEHTPDRLYVLDKEKFYYKEDFMNNESVYQCIGRSVDNILGKQATIKSAREVQNRVKLRTTDIGNKLFYRDKNLFALKNGFLNTHSMKLEPFNEEKYTFNRLEIEYKPELGYEKWEKYVRSIVPDEKQRKSLQEFLGYTLVDGQPAKKLLYLWGRTDSGKTLFMNLLGTFFQSYNYSALNINKLTDKFSIVNLYGKMLNLGGDVSVTSHYKKETDILKSIVGDDEIEGERKYEMSFKFRPRAKIIWSGNGAPSFPKVLLDDEAFIDRWLPIYFPKKFITPTDPRYWDLTNPAYDKELDFDEEHPEGIEVTVNNPEYKNLLVADSPHNIFIKYSTPDIKSQFLNWIIEGIQRLERNGWVFSYDPQYDELYAWFVSQRMRTPEEKEEIDLIKSFMEDTMNVNPMGFIAKEEMHIVFQTWCITFNKTILSEKSFHILFNTNPITKVRDGQKYIIKYKNLDAHGKLKGEQKYGHVWLGVEWKPNTVFKGNYVKKP